MIWSPLPLALLLNNISLLELIYFLFSSVILSKQASLVIKSITQVVA